MYGGLGPPAASVGLFPNWPFKVSSPMPKINTKNGSHTCVTEMSEVLFELLLCGVSELARGPDN